MRTMRITIFGASGAVGSRVVQEALSRDHQVTAVGRNLDRLSALPPEAVRRRGDAADPDDVTALSAGQDLVISATRPVPGSEPELVTAAKGLLAGLAGTGVRLLVVGGAAGLVIPGTGGTTVLDGPDFPKDWRPIAQACNDQLEAIQATTEVTWTYLSPPAILEPGNRTGSYRRGTDELLIDPHGVSRISMEDLAVALLDEAETPTHPNTRFTIAY